MNLNDPKDMLTLLKGVSVVLGAASTVWALTQKTTYDDAAGVKRLTLSGLLSIAIIAGSLVVGITSLGFDSLIRHSEEVEKATKARQNAIDEKQEKLEQERRDADARADRANARLLALQLADAARMRDLRVAAEASRAAALNLAKANNILTQVDRALQPLDTPSLYAMWRYPGPLRVSADLRKKIDAAAATEGDFDAQERLEQTLGYFSVRSYDGVTTVRGQSGSLFPNREDSRDLNLVAMSGVTVAIFQGKSADEVLRLLRLNPQEIRSDTILEHADYAFGVQPGSIDVIYELPAGAMLTSFTASPQPGSIRKSDSIISVQDIENALLIAIPTQFFGEEATAVRRKLNLYNFGLRVSGRDYRFAGDDISRFVVEDGEPIFVIQRIGGR